MPGRSKATRITCYLRIPSTADRMRIKGVSLAKQLSPLNCPLSVSFRFSAFEGSNGTQKKPSEKFSMFIFDSGQEIHLANVSDELYGIYADHTQYTSFRDDCIFFVLHKDTCSNRQPTYTRISLAYQTRPSLSSMIFIHTIIALA